MSCESCSYEDDEAQESRISLEMKPGEVREFDGEQYKAVDCGDLWCQCDCQLLRPNCFKIWDVLGECGAPFRTDATNIVFHKIQED